MKCGILYGIGVGPGDPELITVKGASLLGQCRHVFVPKARAAAESVALAIARRYLGPDAQVHELVFPMTADQDELTLHWQASAEEIAPLLERGEDVCFLTLGDPLLYSTYIYLMRAIRTILSDVNIATVPGVTAFSAAAALSGFPVGEGKAPVTIVPTADDLQDVRRALDGGGTVILMKIGKRLPDIIELLEETGHIDGSAFVSHAGMPSQRVETDLRRLQAENAESGYLSIILVHAAGGKTP
jgi:precorrin-2/cobalt-factor-2 C20-methyltransferase